MSAPSRETRMPDSDPPLTMQRQNVGTEMRGRMLRVVFATALGLSLAATAAPADSPQKPVPATPPGSPAKRALIREVIQVTGTASLMQSMVDQMLKVMRERAPDAEKDMFWRLTARMRVSECLELLIPVYDKYFSGEDLRELVAFSKSPAGQRILKAMTLLTQEGMDVGEKWGQRKAQELMQELLREQEEKNKKASGDAKPGAG
jgi:hypothetical protein